MTCRLLSSLATLIVCLLALPVRGASLSLVSPLEIDDGLAASLGELRGDRLHMGVDYRTQQMTGLPVRAVADGVVVRLKEQWRGYGLALYIEHPNGLVSVYAHLDRVVAPLEARLRKARADRGSRWAGDVLIGSPFPVMQGQTIAWSGESGAGMPHLHLKIRRGMGESVDPFAVGLARPQDPTPPVALRFRLTPTGRGSTVDGSRRPAFVELEGKDGEWVAQRIPIVSGAVDLTLDAFDQVGASNHAGLAGLRVVLDDQEIYRLRFDAISYPQSNTAGVILDLAHSGLAPTRYAYRLSGIDGASLPFTSGRTGPLRFDSGKHRLEVELFDATAPSVARSHARLDLDAVTAGAMSDDPIDLDPPTAPLTKLELIPRGDALFLFAEFLFADVAKSGTSGGKGSSMPRQIRATLGGQSLTLTHTGVGYEGEAAVRDGDLTLAVGTKQLQVAVKTLRPDRLETLHHEGLTLQTPPGALYSETTVAARAVEASAIEKGLSLRGSAIALLPDGHPLRNAAQVSFDPSLAGPKSGVYRLEPESGRWSFLDVGARSEVRRLATYALIDDRAAPSIGGITPDPASSIRPGDLQLRVSVTDVGTGIPERGVRMTIGSAALDVAYDPDRDRAEASWRATAGVHTLKIHVEDYVGNVTEQTLKLRVGK